MYCKYCGEALADGAALCPSCSLPVEGNPAGDALAAGLPASSERAAAPRVRDAVANEYAHTTVANNLVTVASDCYESLGWELTASQTNPVQSTTTLSFKRRRGLQGKAQLIKLQRKVDDLVRTLATLESSKSRKATTAALTLGVPSLLVMGLGMSLTMVWGGGLMIPGIIVGVLGILGCAGAFLLYRSVYGREEQVAASQIEATYDALATVCEEAQVLLRGQRA